ncbi:hypothetical protein DPMN_112380 [Dreissena polymorpha]|uniref:Uncharacterized protein n=1 Tax=Dreissena polymorpha TaxID=45954 RepID=A0A9D4KGQ1_DREPO|nr:hypothetical protein DPMN_112380 [Dreissena polymorpha]
MRYPSGQGVRTEDDEARVNGADDCRDAEPNHHPRRRLVAWISHDIVVTYVTL